MKQHDILFEVFEAGFHSSKDIVPWDNYQAWRRKHDLPPNPYTEPYDRATDLLWRAFRAGNDFFLEEKDNMPLPKEKIEQRFEAWLKIHDDGCPYKVRAGYPVPEETREALRALASGLPCQHLTYAHDYQDACVSTHQEDDHSVHCWEIAKAEYAGTPRYMRFMATANPAVVISLLDEIEELKKKLGEK